MKKMSPRREDKGKALADKPRRNRSRYIIEEVSDTANLIPMPQLSQQPHHPLMNPTPPLIHLTLPYMYPTPPFMCPSPSPFTNLLSTPYSTFPDISPLAFLSPLGHTS
ncbi:hypothetical protein RYX36_004561 [Vicia faba]